MPKQQTLTIIVSDDMADPADLVESAFRIFFQIGPIRLDNRDEDLELEFAHRDYDGYMILEEE
jgi:hypothetical protein